MPSLTNPQIESISTFFDTRSEAQQNLQAALAASGTAMPPQGIQCEDDDDEVGEAQADIDLPVFFSIVKVKPSAGKHIHVNPGAGRSLSSDHVGVMVHRASPAPDQISFYVCADEGASVQFSDQVGILLSLSHEVPSLAQINDIESGLLQWQISDHVLFEMPGCPRAHELVSLLVHANAIEGRGSPESGSPMRIAAKHHATMQTLLAAGHTHGDIESGVVLARQALQQLRLTWLVTNPNQFFDIRENIPWGDRTKYELVRMLESRGFVAKSPVIRCRVKPYAAGREKVWYTSAKPPWTPLHAYLQALLRSEDLRWFV